MTGVILHKPLPTYPHGFPAGLVAHFELAIGRKVIGNKAASGTEIIKELGEEHLRTGRPISTHQPIASSRSQRTRK